MLAADFIGNITLCFAEEMQVNMDWSFWHGSQSVCRGHDPFSVQPTTRSEFALRAA